MCKGNSYICIPDKYMTITMEKRFSPLRGFLFAAVMATASLGVSCSGDGLPEDVPSGKVEMEFTAGFSVDTRTVLTGSNGVDWVAGDSISLFDPLGDNNIFKTSEGGASVTFRGSASHADGDYYAIYPYDASATLSGATVSSVLSPVQTAVPGTFAGNTNQSVAKADGTELYFKNVCALVKFTLIVPEGISVKRVALRSNGGEPVAGDFIADISAADPSAVAAEGNAMSEIVLEGDFASGSTYYMVVLPADMKSGLTVTVYDSSNRIWTRKASKEVSLSAGKVADIGTLEPVSFISQDGYEIVDGVYHIRTAEGLQNWSMLGDLSSDVMIVDNLDMASVAWSPVGSLEHGYAGDFDGNGKKITNLQVATDFSNAGLFGGISGEGKVHDLIIEGADIRTTSSSSSSGVIAGFSIGEISSCTVLSSSVSGWYVGALAGNNSGKIMGSTVTDAEVKSVYAGGCAGAAAGVNYGLIDGCSVSGTETVISSDVSSGNAGGIAGLNSEENNLDTSGRIYRCDVSGVTVSGVWAGGIAGDNSFGTVAQCSVASVSIRHSVSASSARLGGIVGYNTRGSVVACSCISSSVGVGMDSEAAGGIAGYCYAGTSGIFGCYSSGVSLGTVAGSESGRGAVAGYSNGDVISCYALLPEGETGVSLVGKGNQAEYSVEPGSTGYEILINAPDFTAGDGSVWKASGIWGTASDGNPPVIDGSYPGEPAARVTAAR